MTIELELAKEFRRQEIERLIEKNETLIRTRLRRYPGMATRMRQVQDNVVRLRRQLVGLDYE